MNKLTKLAPAWHAEVAAELNKDFTEINAVEMTQAKRRAYLGLKFIFVKEKGKADQSIPHGAFSDWLEENCPAIPRRTIGDYITEAKSLMERMGWQNGEIRHFEIPPHKLLEMPKGDLKPKDQKAQQLLLDLVEGNGKFRRVTEYKQVKEGADAGERTNARGAAKGSRGCTKEMRLKAQYATDAERLLALKLWTEGAAMNLTDNLHLQGFPRLDEVKGGKKILDDFIAVVADAHSFLQNLKKSRS